MEQETDKENLLVITSLLQDGGLISAKAKRGHSDLRFLSLVGDGSSRKFYRIKLKDRPLCLAVAPASEKEEDLFEARSARLIGSHLLENGVPVPRQYGYSDSHGIILFEDLGDTKLHDLVIQMKLSKKSVHEEAVRSWYRQVIDGLLVMQVKAAKGFDPGWCWQGACYDRNVMIEKESVYFIRSCWQDLLNKEVPEGVEEEFDELAGRCQEQPPIYFLHRDFQSRNIMVKDDSVCFIDFQGGRFGPLQYDLASLLIDPYVALPKKLQLEFMDYYLDHVQKEVGIERKKLVQGYEYLALQRNLQIVGAFSFLSQRRRKVFFRQYIYPALVLLNDRLALSCFDDFPILRKIAASSLVFLKEVQSL